MNPVGALRLDLTLCNLRFFKTRALAQEFIAKGRVRINGEKVTKSSRLVRIGDKLVFVVNNHVHAIEILGLVDRRVGAPIAQTLYSVVDR